MHQRTFAAALRFHTTAGAAARNRHTATFRRLPPVICPLRLSTKIPASTFVTDQFSVAVNVDVVFGHDVSGIWDSL
jgi:hypothetical protein